MHKPHPPSRRPTPGQLSDPAWFPGESDATNQRFTPPLAGRGVLQQHRERARRQTRQTCELLDRLETP